tara:strand:+ start:77 stop:841 length:765 start_codon:yes stop_codon:yes gene_type:complete
MDNFRSWIDEDRQVLPTYWRGQTDPDWPLASSFEREILRLGTGGLKSSNIYPYDNRYKREGRRIWEEGFYDAIRDRYLEAFKSFAAGMRGVNPTPLDTDQWWALGRHYGLVTPLLDWSESPYIAAFFPLTEMLSRMTTSSGISFSGGEIALYRLFHNKQLEGDGLRVIRPRVEELSRMHGQRGLFTWLNSEEFFELQGFLENTGRGDLLTKVTISDQAVLDGLRDLRSHGIDYKLLFPDLTGAAQSANTRWDVI